MNELYAVDPNAVKNSRELKLLLDQFGFHKGRFLADYPMDWIDEARKHFRDSSEMERARVVEHLSRAKGTLAYDVFAPYKSTLTWLENAKRTERPVPLFEAMIAEQELPPRVASVEQVIYEDKLADGVGEFVPRTVESYLKVVKPLLAASTEVTLVDRYFRLRNNRGFTGQFSVLAGMLSCAIKLGKCQSFKVMALRAEALKDCASEACWKADLEKARPRHASRSIEVAYDLSEKLGHGRYIFSVRGGLQFDQGFDIDAPRSSSTNHVHWLSQKELNDVQKAYAP